MKRLLVEPLDVLMFRSERPFAAGETHIAKTGIINPLTFEGAIKSKIFADFCKRIGVSPREFQRFRSGKENIDDFNKTRNNLIEFVNSQINDIQVKKMLELIGYSPLNIPSQFNVLGVFPSRGGNVMEHFPIPNDLVRLETDEEKNKIAKLKPRMEIGFKWNGIDLYAGFSESSQVKNLDNRYMDLNSLREYLYGRVPENFESAKNVDNSSPFTREIRTGIELEKGAKTTKEGALYTAEFIRLNTGWSFVLWYEYSENIFSKEEIIKLGGEGRGAVVKPIEDMVLNWKDLIAEINKEKKFKIYLATPSYLGGSVPPAEKLQEFLGVRKLVLVGALPGKPVYIGGYDISLNVEKPLKRLVNAGAVYYYTFEGEIDENLALPIKILGTDIDIRSGFISRW